MQSHASYKTVFVWIGSLGMLAGCGPSIEVIACCPDEHQIRGVCAGVPQAAECNAIPCTEGVACTSVAHVGTDAELQAAAMQAMPGACIALAPGKYGAVSLPGGVSLLGRSAAEVSVGQVTVSAGQGAVLCGFAASTATVSGMVTPTVHIHGATGVKIESVHISGTAEIGVLVGPQSSVEILTSTIEGPAHYGVYAEDSLEVDLDRVVIAGAGGPGLWVASSGTCIAPSPQPPVLNATRSVFRGNHVAGIALFGTEATLRKVDILATVPGDKLAYGKHGGGLYIAECSMVDMTGLRVHDSKKVGVLVDASTGTIGGLGTDEEVEIHRNDEVGLWISGGTASFKLENAQLEENAAVGIGLSEGSQGILIHKTKVSKTWSSALPTTGIDSAEIGHGLVWTGKSDAILSDVTLSGNALVSVLIDGEASGTLHAVTLSGGDEIKGIVHQNFTAGGKQPTFIGGTPAPHVAAGEVYPVPYRPPGLPKNP